jgi:hypothetical protein
MTLGLIDTSQINRAIMVSVVMLAVVVPVNVQQKTNNNVHFNAAGMLKLYLIFKIALFLFKKIPV